MSSRHYTSLWYSGMEIGMKRGLVPVPDFADTLLPDDYESHILNRMQEGVFREFEQMLHSTDWKAALDTMLCNWYPEFSNFTMTNDSCALAGMQYCHPFSSVDLLDYSSSLPEKWKVDKMIQKDMCYNYLNMPKSVAYRCKNHSRDIPYGVLVYPYMQTIEFERQFKERVNGTDFGPLNEGINHELNLKWVSPEFKFALYGLMLWMHEYNLKIE